MPAISITDDQRERLRWIQRRLGDDVAYGHVRPRDALEYLLDRFDESDADATTARAAAPAGAGPRDRSEVAVADEDAPGVVVGGGGDSDGDDGDDNEGAPASSAAASATPATTTAAAAPIPEGDDDETRLNSVMSLLADHGEKWRETGGGDEKYEVDLPGGGTERARTKDDVRALLFRHYR